MSGSETGVRIAIGFPWRCLLALVTGWIWLDPHPVAAQAVDWQEFRGPSGAGIGPEEKLPEDWTGGALAWKVTLPGRGWSSPVIADGQAWMSAAIESGADPASSQELRTVERIELVALCVDLGTGRVVHQVPLFSRDNPVALHPLNSYASPTPVIAGDGVVFSFGDMGTACVERTSGRIRWQHDHFDLEHETGPGSSPVVWQDRVILHLDGTDRQSVAALDLATGKVLWETPRSGELHPEGMMKKAFCTPLILEQGERVEVISPGANHVYGYDPRDGRELWRYTYGQLGFSNVPRPVWAGGLMYVCTGYNRASLLALRPSASPGEGPELAWQYNQKVPTMPSPLVYDGRLFMVSDDGIATALDATSGQKLWQARLGGNYSASPIVVGGELYFANRDGEMIVVEPGDQFRKLRSHQLDSAVMATPVPLRNGLLIRTAETLHCIRNQPRP